MKKLILLLLTTVSLQAQLGIGPETAIGQSIKNAADAAAVRGLITLASTNSVTFSTLTLTNASSNANPMTRLKSNTGLPQLVLEDGDAADAQEPFWYLQSANNGSAGVFYLGFADRSGTSLTGNADAVSLTSGGAFNLLVAGSAIRGPVGAGETLLLQARDVDGAIWTTFGTLTANNTPTFDLATTVTKNSRTIPEIITATAALDFASIPANTTANLTITVTGAAVGDAVFIGPPAAPEAGLTFTGFVSAADTITIRAGNVTVGAIDPASATFRATVVK